MWIVALAALFVGGLALANAARYTTRALPDAANVTYVPPSRGGKMTGPRKILFLGDSLTASGYWTQIKLPDVATAGQGWPGQGIKAVLAAALPLVAKEQPTDIVLLAGANGVASQHGAKRVKADLTKAWQQLKASGARVWAVKLTPWFGYQFKRSKYHAAGPISESMKTVTHEVNQWIQSVAGTADGPDFVIDTSALGDADYQLLEANSYDGLHMSKRGYAALAALVQAALAAGPAPVSAADVEAQVGEGALERAVAHARETFTDRLVRNDLAPASVRVERGNTIVFSFYTPFRKQQADELLPSSSKYGAQLVYLRNEVIGDAEVGQVLGESQSTPWTCGPAALRAVLAHHGVRVSEDDVALLAGNVPVLGVRPSGLVQAARELGCRADVFQARSLAALAPFLARDLPVMIVIDSFTQPGKAGHWVVVTELSDKHVKIMDPHVAGCWRTLTPADLDARWWHRENGREVKHLALVVTPEDRLEGDE